MSRGAGSTHRTAASARGDETRAAILRCAQALFAKNGFRGTSLASVAHAAGLSQPGLLHHFPSKAALLLAVLAERDHHDGRLSAAALTRNGLGILPALGTLVEHNQATPEMVRLFSLLLGEGLAESHPAHHYFTDRYRRIRSRILHNLTHAGTADEIRQDADLEALATLVVAVMDGLQFQWLLGGDVDMVRCYRVFCSLVESSLAAGHQPEP